MLSSRVQYDLYNWHFRTAKLEMDRSDSDPTDCELDVVCALATTFGDCGRFVSELGIVINAAVRSVLSLIDDLEDGSLQKEIFGG